MARRKAKAHKPTIITEPCCVSYSVYADYDGEAPDSWTLCRCTTKELAEEVCQLLTTFEESTDEAIFFGKEEFSPSLPLTEGSEYAKSYQVREEVCRVRDVARTLRDALVQL